MTSRRVTEAFPLTDADVGKFINCDPMWNFGICHKPAEVVKVSKSRVYIREAVTDRWDDEIKEWTLKPGTQRESYVMMKSVKFVSDTFVEADLLFQMSRNCIKDTNEAISAVSEKYSKLVGNMLT